MNGADNNRKRLRQTFNQAAESYQRALPDYPYELFGELIAITGLAQVTVSWKSAAPPARSPSPWAAGASRSPA